MAELHFFHGTMDCGKSTLALQLHHNATAAGKRCLLFAMHDREGAVVSTRIGLSHEAIEVRPDLDFEALVRDRVGRGEPVDELICDEAQFYTEEQVEQLARVVDDLDVDVRCFGLLTDFATRLFPGSRRLIELADRREQMQVEALCWCGARATHNARVRGGRIVREGEQVVIGDVEDAVEEAAGGWHEELHYEVLCRRHHRAGITRARARSRGDLPGPAAPRG